MNKVYIIYFYTRYRNSYLFSIKIEQMFLDDEKDNYIFLNEIIIKMKLRHGQILNIYKY